MNEWRSGASESKHVHIVNPNLHCCDSCYGCRCHETFDHHPCGDHYAHNECREHDNHHNHHDHEFHDHGQRQHHEDHCYHDHMNGGVPNKHRVPEQDNYPEHHNLHECNDIHEQPHVFSSCSDARAWRELRTIKVELYAVIILLLLILFK